MSDRQHLPAQQVPEFHTPTLSFDGTPADYVFPDLSQFSLEHRDESSIERTYGGMYELSTLGDSESGVWSFTWDSLNLNQTKLLHDASLHDAVQFTDPLGRLCTGQVQNVRVGSVSGRTHEDGSVMYSGSCDIALLQTQANPWIPELVTGISGVSKPNEPIAFYGTVHSSLQSARGYLDATGTLYPAWGTLEHPVTSTKWDRSARDGLDTDPATSQPYTVTAAPLHARRGSVKILIQTGE